MILNRQGKLEEALSAFEAAIAGDPNHSPAFDWRGTEKIFLGRAEEAQADLEQAIRTSPRDPRLCIMLCHMGVAKLYIGQDQEAIELLRRAVSANPEYTTSYLHLAPAYALVGDLEKARDLGIGAKASPHKNIRSIMAHLV
jgi:adenylate cyclase